MAHVPWHFCITIGDETGEKVPLKLKEGKRGNTCGLVRLPHSWTDEEAKAKVALADQKVMELIEIFRQPQESIVFNPMQGTPSVIEEPPPG